MSTPTLEQAREVEELICVMYCVREGIEKKNIESVSMLITRGGGGGGGGGGGLQASAHTSLCFFLHAPNLLVWL